MADFSACWTTSIGCWMVLVLAFVLCQKGAKAASGFLLDMPNYEQEALDSSPSSKSSSLVSSIVVAMATVAVLAVVVLLLAVAWRRYPSVSSLFDSLGNRRQRHVPSSVRHRLRLRLPASVTAAVDSSSDSPISTTGWAPQLLAQQAKRLQLLQSRKDSGDSDVMKTGSRTQQLSSRQQSCTTSDLLPVDAELTFFDRRLELLSDDSRLI